MEKKCNISQKVSKIKSMAVFGVTTHSANVGIFYFLFRHDNFYSANLLSTCIEIAKLLHILNAMMH